MASLSSRETVDRTKATIGELGARYMLHPETMAIGTEAKYPNGFAWYMAGRGGVLGDVDADVVYAGFGFFGPDLIRKMWEAGIAVESPRLRAPQLPLEWMACSWRFTRTQTKQ